MVSPREVFFDSSGVRCAADLYLPDHVSLPVPCVVMGHGGSGIKRLGLPAYAEKFARGGIAALVFDYRRFGASDGEPRQAIDVDAQRDDYRAAIRYVRGLPGIDEAHIAIWGTFTARTVQFTVAALRDRRRARRGEPPYLVPAVAHPDRSRCSPSLTPQRPSTPWAARRAAGAMSWRRGSSSTFPSTRPVPAGLQHVRRPDRRAGAVRRHPALPTGSLRRLPRGCFRGDQRPGACVPARPPDGRHFLGSRSRPRTRKRRPGPRWAEPASCLMRRGGG